MDFDSYFQISGDDNSELVDNSESQKLSKEDIEKMKSEGKDCGEIVEQLAENSQSFKQKTKFSQDKFITKKAKKYFLYLVSIFTIYI